MGLFGDDKRQDERLDALERHIRAVTETVQRNQLDIAACRIGILAVQAEIDAAAEAIQSRLDEKVSTDDVDPVLQELNKELGEGPSRGIVTGRHRNVVDAAGRTARRVRNASHERQRGGR